LLGQLAAGDDRVVPIAFHVDYFNDPWKDPFSSPDFSRRQALYSRLYDKTHRLNKPDYLYLTPLILIDGQVPMVGSNKDAPTKARAALTTRATGNLEVDLRAELRPGADPFHATLLLDIQALAARADGREVLIGVAVTEDNIRTRVEAGELKGRDYIGRFVARSLAVKTATPRRSRPARLEIPITLDPAWNPANCEVVVYAQDDTTGRIAQAASRPWPNPAPEPDTKRPPSAIRSNADRPPDFRR
jgi:hypothetical protein